jgi:hypothetical protein
VRAVMLLWLLCHPTVDAVQSQQSPQTPSEQQSDRALKEQEKGTPKAQGSPAPAPLAPMVHPPGRDRERQRHTGQGDDESSEFWTISGRRVKITDTLLVVFTFVLSVATVFLWLSTRRLVKGAENTAERQLRAYVFSERARIEDAFSPKGGSVLVVIKNFGQTPAYDHSVTFDYLLVGKGERCPANEPRQTALSRGHMAPSVPKGINISLRAWGSGERAALESGDQILYVFGRIRYTDAFEKRRSTCFCYAFGGVYGSSDSADLVTAEHGHDSD